MFPIGRSAEILAAVWDPQNPKELPKGSKVTVNDILVQSSASAAGWIVCKDSGGFLWSIRPKDLKILEPEKGGRYYILKKNSRKRLGQNI